MLLPLTVQVKQPHRVTPVSIRMESGRLMAQCAHVVSKMRMAQVENIGMEPITTITLSVRNTREMMKVMKELQQKVTVYGFLDKNPPFYGVTSSVPTAVCTVPVRKSVIKDAIGHLELYRAPGE